MRPPSHYKHSTYGEKFSGYAFMYKSEGIKKYDNVLSMVSLAIFFMYMDLWYLKSRKRICMY